MNKADNVIQIPRSAARELYASLQPELDRIVAACEAHTPRETLTHETVKLLRAREVDEAMAHSIMARLIVDMHIKARSDGHIPGLKQLSMFADEENVRASVVHVVHEGGDGTVTPFDKMSVIDFDERDARKFKHAKEALDAAVSEADINRRIRPLVAGGMSPIDALVSVWNEVRPPQQKEA